MQLSQHQMEQTASDIMAGFAVVRATGSHLGMLVADSRTAVQASNNSEDVLAQESPSKFILQHQPFEDIILIIGPTSPSSCPSGARRWRW